MGELININYNIKVVTSLWEYYKPVLFIVDVDMKRTGQNKVD